MFMIPFAPDAGPFTRAQKLGDQFNYFKTSPDEYTVIPPRDIRLDQLPNDQLQGPSNLESGASSFFS